MKKIYFFFLLSMHSLLYALPSGASVQKGEVEFVQEDPGHLRIHASDKAIIHYQNFHIGSDEQVHFVLASKESAVLSRVVGGNPSQILGKLTSNGKLFLVNPYGIYFGKDASIHVGSIVASTLDLADDDFLNDRFQFFLPEGRQKSTLINEGTISAPDGFIALFSPTVENRGQLMALSGKVAIGSAEKITLDFDGDGMIQFKVDGDLEKALIENHGQIEAAGGVVQIGMLSARNAVKMVVNADGVEVAGEIEEANGIIRLISSGRIQAGKVFVDGGEGSRVEVSGQIDASNLEGLGGRIEILGDELRLTGAQIDASGDTGGGEVYVGGEYLGGGVLRTAKNHIVDPTTVIKANAITNGDGGEVIIWSDVATIFNGKIFARGGEESGDGGFVETSGKINLGVHVGYVETIAPKGKSGTWLMDPTTLNIQTGGPDSLTCGGTCSGSECTIDPSALSAPTSGIITFCTGSTTNIYSPFSNANNVFFYFAPNSTSKTVNISAGANISIPNGALDFETTSNVNIGGDITIITSNTGGYLGDNQASVVFTGTVSGPGVLTLQGSVWLYNTSSIGPLNGLVIGTAGEYTQNHEFDGSINSSCNSLTVYADNLNCSTPIGASGEPIPEVTLNLYTINGGTPAISCPPPTGCPCAGGCAVDVRSTLTH